MTMFNCIAVYRNYAATIGGDLVAPLPVLLAHDLVLWALFAAGKMSVYIYYIYVKYKFITYFLLYVFQNSRKRKLDRMRIIKLCAQHPTYTFFIIKLLLVRLLVYDSISQEKKK